MASLSSRPIQKAVVPAAGLGIRLRPLTYAFPKELLPIGRKPVLAHIATELLEAGITEALFIVNARKPQIRAYFGEIYQEEQEEADSARHASAQGEKRVLRCAYVEQQDQRGLGDALLYAQEWVGSDTFAVAFGDCLMEARQGNESPLTRLMATHSEQHALASVLVETVDWAKVSRYGVLAPETTLPDFSTLPFPARDIIEKPAREQAPSNRVVAARWILTPAIFSYLRALNPDARGEINLTDAVRAMRQACGGLWAVPLLPGEARRDIGDFETFFANFVRTALRDPEYGSAARQAAREVLAQGEPS